MKLKHLAVNHPYYCSESNFYSNEPALKFPDIPAFLQEFGGDDCDIDMNLCFRWDVTPNTNDDNKEDGSYHAQVFLIHQRKGIFRPIYIESITEADVDAFVAYLKPHKERLLQNWKPL